MSLTSKTSTPCLGLKFGDPIWKSSKEKAHTTARTGGSELNWGLEGELLSKLLPLSFLVPRDPGQWLKRFYIITPVCLPLGPILLIY